MSIFMNYPGVQGDTSDAAHRNWLDIEDLNWSVSRSITSNPATGKDRESANAEMTDLTIIRRLDRATPALFLESCCGKGKDIVIHLCKTGSGRGTDVYMEYTLKNALISRYRMKGYRQSGTRPREQLRISFQQLELKYTPYDDAGNPEPPIAVAFDPTTNEKS